jgi:hypothetical protein
MVQAVLKAFAFIALIICLVLAYAVGKTMQANRQSKIDWENVDQSKLKKWSDDDDWPEPK